MVQKKQGNDLSLAESIGIIAFRNRIFQDQATQHREMCRRFSILFHVPLPEVEKLSLEYVLLHLYEYRFSNMESEELKKFKHNLLKRIEHDIEQEDEDWIAENEYEALKQDQELLNEKNKKSAVKQPPPDINMKF